MMVLQCPNPPCEPKGSILSSPVLSCPSPHPKVVLLHSLTLSHQASLSTRSSSPSCCSQNLLTNWAWCLSPPNYIRRNKSICCVGSVWQLSLRTHFPNSTRRVHCETSWAKHNIEQPQCSITKPNMHDHNCMACTFPFFARPCWVS
jgi:hypothetical protein